AEIRIERRPDAEILPRRRPRNKYGATAWSLRARERSLRALAENHDLDRVEQDRQVEQERLVLDVEQIVLQLLQRILEGAAVPIIDLRPARQSRLHDVTLLEVRDLLRQVVHEMRPLRPRADQRHVAGQHVEQLRQLVEARLADELARAR